MKITITNTEKHVPHNEIRNGTPMLFSGEIYIKLRDAKVNLTHGLIDIGCAVMLKNGSPVGFHPDTQVTPLNFTNVELAQV